MRGTKSGRRSRVRVAALALLGVSTAFACLDRPVSPVQPQTTNLFVDQIPYHRVDKLDLLFVIDNSASMADKQLILEKAAPELLRRLTFPLCVDAETGAPIGGNAGADGKCASGLPEFEPLKDIRIGVISSSLGGRAGEHCEPVSGGYTPEMNDAAHLLPSVRPDAALGSHGGGGFLWWAPELGGSSDPDQLITDFKAHVRATGESGCGYEAPLEAWYRFLVDPAPSAAIQNQDGLLVAQGVDEVLLSQRRAFLRPDSLLSIVMLTDENDCSIRDDGDAWRVASTQLLPRSTSACEKDPDSPCCTSCLAVNPPPPECVQLADDPECMKGAYTTDEDRSNLRCWEQKRRFGVDFLFPIERYVKALKDPCVIGRDGQAHPNPLYFDLSDPNADGSGWCELQDGRALPRPGAPSRPRDASLVYLAGIVGVPWQLVSTPESQSDPTRLEYLSSSELEARGVWSKITRTHGAPPTDPHMVESPLPRAGLPPPSSPPAADPIHGHEYDALLDERGDLQYACSFPLLPPDPDGPDCQTAGNMTPLCQDPQTGSHGDTQFAAKAYPALRELAVLRDYGENSIVASICPKHAGQNSLDERDPNFGYNPAVSAIVSRLKEALRGRCLPRPLQVESGMAQCTVVEAAAVDGDCSALGRAPIDDQLAARVRSQLRDRGACAGSCSEFRLCGIVPSSGAAREACLTDPSEQTQAPGWCYVDPGAGIGSQALVAQCPATERRLLRVVGEDTPLSGSIVFIACLGSPL